MTRIKVLSDAEARKIAAGEVIDRGAHLVREFVDNALDGGAKNIEVSIEGGGAHLVEVWDDGCGMTRGDLLLCVEDHATSKITSLDDLLTARTLGFRGEALSAARAVSELEIISSVDGNEAWRYLPNDNIIEKTVRKKGTTVRARYLFDKIPARKHFLKNANSEAALCRRVFLEKAAAHPAVSFRYRENGALKLFFTAETLKERFARCFSLESYIHALYVIEAAGANWKAQIAAGAPGLSRQDRKLQFVFANGRHLDDWWLKHALEAGLQGGFPNSEHPVGAIFLDVDPSCVDFNIHPAKREAKFKNAAEIHHGISSALQDFLRKFLEREGAAQNRHYDDGRKNSKNASDSERVFADKSYNGSFLQERAENLASAADSSNYAQAQSAQAQSAQTQGVQTQGARFVGRVWGVFLLVEIGDKLLLVDQHAAHERLLYDEYIARRFEGEALLVPLPFETETDEEDEFFASNIDALRALGLSLQQDAPHLWQILALPRGWTANDSATQEAVRALPHNGARLLESWAASAACHTAVRDGAFLDDKTALDLVLRALSMPIQRCPHGRPIFVEITAEALLKGVKRL